LYRNLFKYANFDWIFLDLHRLMESTFICFLSKVMNISTRQITLDTQELPSLSQEGFYSSIWQTLAWTQMLLRSKVISKSFFVCRQEENLCVEYAFLEKRSIGAWRSALFCIGWPIALSSEISEEFIAEITALARWEDAVFVQIEPLFDLKGLESFTPSSYKKFVQPYTIFIDLTKSEEEILAGMKQKGRYNIKIAQKNDISVTFCPPTEENLQKFMGLLSQTSQRNHFSVNNDAYFRSLLAYSNEANNGGLYVATKDGEWLAAGIFFFFEHVAIYYYGASTGDEAKKRLMAPYLLHLEMIREAKKRGCTVYDFLGIAPPDAPKNHSLAGVTDFKSKFSSWVYQFPQAKIYVLRPVFYSLLLCYRFIRRFV